MKLTDYLHPDDVLVLKGATKQEVLSEMTAWLAEKVEGLTHQSLLEAVNVREGMMSTGIGNSIAVPHVRMREFSKPVISVGISNKGVADYQSLDSKPVRIIVMICAPQGQHEMYIRLLAKVVDVLKRSDLREQIAGMDDPQQIFDILTGAEE